MKFDTTVNLGHVLTIFVLFSSAASIYVATMVRLNEHELRLQQVEKLHTSIIENTKMLNEIQRSLVVIEYRLGNGNGNNIPDRGTRRRLPENP